MVEFVHPGEEAAWNALLKNQAFQTVVDVFQSIHTDLTAFGAMKGRNFLVTENTMPDIYRLYRIAAERLAVTEIPPLYVQMDYAIKAQTLGTDGDCAILINSACLEECSKEQLLALFGQELAHIRYDHIRILNLDAMLDTILTKIPWVGAAASQTLKTLLLQWKEYAYYTADRGAAIAAGEKKAVFQNLSLAMGKKLNVAEIKSVLSENPKEHLSAEQSAAAKVVLQMMINSITLPFGIWRIRELAYWDVGMQQIQELGRSLQPRKKKTTVAQKTVDTADLVAKGLYTGTVRTVEAVKTGAEEAGTYLQENRPVWENNIAQAKEKTTKAIRTGKEEFGSYIERNKPVWENNLTQTREKAAEAVQAGKQDVTNYLKEKAPEWKEQMSSAKSAASDTLRTGVKRLSSKVQTLHKQRKK